MYRLKKLVLHNFGSFQDLEINFTKRGLYLIQGHNMKGGDSNGCLIGNTLIDCPRDLTKYPKGIPIKDLVGKEFLTYSWDGNKIVLKRAHNVHSTGIRPVVKVRVGAGSRMRRTIGQRAGGSISPYYWPPLELIGTTDHLVLLTSGEWKPIGKLERGDSIVSLYRRKDPKMQNKILWTGGDAVVESQYICHLIYGPRPENYHSHHKNKNPFDNNPYNLEWKDGHVHLSEHTSERNRLSLAGWKVTGIHPRGMLGKHHHGENHRVWSAPEVMGEEDTYDMTVDDTNNFIANGMVVHNSGKTMIMSGIVWTLFGRTQTGLQGKDVARWGESNCTGILTLVEGNNIFEIIRSLEELEFRINGTIQAGNKRDLQDTINKTFNTDYNLFKTFNIFSSTWSTFITSAGDADKKKLFKNILKMNKIDEAYDKAKKIYAGLTVQATKLEILMAQLFESIPEQEKELQALTEYKNNEKQIKLDAIADVEYQRDTLKPDIVDVSDELKEITSKLANFDLVKLTEDLNLYTIKLTNIKGLIYSEEDSISQKDEEIRAFSATSAACPTCGQGIPPRHRQAYRRQLEIIRKEMFNSLQDSIKEKDAINTEIYTIEDKFKMITNLQSRIKELEMLQWKNKVDLEQYENYCKTADEAISKLLETKDETINSYDELISTTEIKLNKSKEDLKLKQDAFGLLKKEIDFYSYIIWLYSRQGIVSIIVEKCFGRLKYLANRYLLKISTEGFKIDIAPQKALKSGEIREEIDLYILDEGKKIPYASLSSGQQQRVNTAMLFAMYTWGREIGASNFDFILLDEIMDLSLGLKGQEDTLEMIYFFRPMIYHILLITHKEAMTGRFDKEIEVIRSNGGISKVAI